MKTLFIRRLMAVALLFSLSRSVLGQGAFQNLGFEAATLPTLNPNESGGFLSVSVATALPGWRAFFGSTLINNVSHNADSLGAVNLSVYGPNYAGSIINGNFAVSLQAGANASAPSERSVTISQSGQIPFGTLSLELSIGTGAENYQVAVNQVPLSLTPIVSTTAFTTFRADVSAWAGSTVELQLSSLWTPNRPLNPVQIDNLQFTPIPVPEPGVVALLLGGIAVLFTTRRLRRRGVLDRHV